MADFIIQDAQIEEMTRDLHHRAKLEREIHNDYNAAKYLDSIASIVHSVIELREENIILSHENKRLKKRIAELREQLLSSDF